MHTTLATTRALLLGVMWMVGSSSLAAAQGMPVAYALSPNRATAEETRPGMSRPLEMESEPYVLDGTGDDLARFEVMGGVTAPLGPELTLRLSMVERVLIQASIGTTTFGAMFRDVAVMSGAEATYADAARWIDGGVSVRAAVGFQLFEGLGFELMFGYAMLSRSLDVGQSVAAMAGSTGYQDRIQGSLTLQALTLELGYTFTVLEHFLIRPSIGVLHVIEADATATSSTLSDNDVGQIESVAGQVEDGLRQYGTVPTLGVSMGYRF